VQEGEVAKVGDSLCVIETEEDTSDASASPSPADGLSHQDQRRDASNPPAVSEDPRAASRPHPLDPNDSPAPEFKTSSAADSATQADVLALPAVRHFARQNEVDITLLAPGSGKNGRVERVDVERYLSRAKSVGEQPSLSEEDVVVELGRTRYGMWKAMEKVRKLARSSSIRFHNSSLQSLEIPHFG
jgi:2-oxoisovalerate dehydrogenase E2 component (dihydrolipoyl transacylase)